MIVAGLMLTYSRAILNNEVLRKMNKFETHLTSRVVFEYFTLAYVKKDVLEKSCIMRLLSAGSTLPESDVPVAFLAPELRARIWGLHRLAPIKHLQSPETCSATECTGVGIY